MMTHGLNSTSEKYILDISGLQAAVHFFTLCFQK